MLRSIEAPFTPPSPFKFAVNLQNDAYKINNATTRLIAKLLVSEEFVELRRRACEALA